ncbi:MAG: TIGR04282 family arsenosugar biosynthesis glycosyltransferase [Aurantibacter sp.]
MKVVLQHTTAILVFARSSGEELRHKKIAEGGQLFEVLTEHTLKTVKMTGLPVFHIAENLQQGVSFGERFANAVQYVFDQGYENVIAVGNDSPNLTRFHIEKAFAKLENGKSVIGPSADGGFYLMGLNRANFKKPDFISLSWQTSQLREEILKLLSDSGQETFLLPTLFDIDTFWDIKILGKYTFGLDQKLLKIIRSMLSSKEKIEIPTLFFFAGFPSKIPFNKGSPSSFLSL